MCTLGVRFEFKKFEEYSNDNSTHIMVYLYNLIVSSLTHGPRDQLYVDMAALPYLHVQYTYYLYYYSLWLVVPE